MTDPIAEKLRREADAAKGLIASLSEYGDDVLHDMAEGETSIMEAIDAALVEIDECDAIVAGCKSQIEVYAERSAKFSQRKDRVRGLIEQAMLISGLATAKRPVATLSVKNTPPKPMITDESLVPSRFFKTPPPALDRVALNKAAKEGEAIPGVQMDNGGISLQIRRL